MRQDNRQGFKRMKGKRRGLRGVTRGSVREKGTRKHGKQGVT